MLIPWGWWPRATAAASHWSTRARPGWCGLRPAVVRQAHERCSPRASDTPRRSVMTFCKVRINSCKTLDQNKTSESRLVDGITCENCRPFWVASAGPAWWGAPTSARPLGTPWTSFYIGVNLYKIRNSFKQLLKIVLCQLVRSLLLLLYCWQKSQLRYLDWQIGTLLHELTVVYTVRGHCLSTVVSFVP